MALICVLNQNMDSTFVEYENLTLKFNYFLISTLNLELNMIIFMIHNCWLGETIFKDDPTAIDAGGVGSAHKRY